MIPVTKSTEPLSPIGNTMSAYDQVSRYCMFVGHPRSGQTLLSAMLNAHKNAVIAHEVNALTHVLRGSSRAHLFALLLSRDRWFTDQKDTSSGFSYRVPNQWQGRYERLNVIGDKKGAGSAIVLHHQPTALDRLRDVIGVPLCVVHVVRNPFDNIARIARSHRTTLAQSVEVYFAICQSLGNAMTRVKPNELLVVRHESFIASPRETLRELCRFVELPAYPRYLEDCSNAVYCSSRPARHAVPWSSKLRRDVEARLQDFPFLTGYCFDSGAVAELSASASAGG